MKEIIYYLIEICHYFDLPAELILVAETKDGICAILFGNYEDALLSELASIFPNKIINKRKNKTPNTIINFIDGIGEYNPKYQNHLPINLPPLDFQTGTNFQQSVWMALLKIPRGITITYKELAEKIGKPKAWRAVASACGHNNIGFLVPCHRVISSSGEIGKYRWGTELKQKFLEMEKDGD